MSDTKAKPLTADEIGATKQAATWSAEMWPFAPPEIHQIIPRLIATIEQQAEQIVKLREVVKQCREAALYVAALPANPNPNFTANVQAKFFAAHEAATEVLAATEPVNDKR